MLKYKYILTDSKNERKICIMDNLNETTWLLDGSLKDEELFNRPYVFNDLRKLLYSLNESSNVTVYVKPYVYWIDDPDATDEVVCEEGYEVPFGVVVRSESLRFIGLGDNRDEVIFAGNRGQSHGSKGNYTMFFFIVNHLEMENITIANYCSIDLEYPYKPELNHKKRTSTITQAQLGMQQGDRFFAKNCNFISRLNMMPVNGGKRCLYKDCHFESTDDALNGHAVYLDCDFDFYGNRPIYYTVESGAVFLNCLFNGRIIAENVERKQYFTKEGGPVTVVNCRYETKTDDKNPGIGWTKYPNSDLKCYQSNMLYDGKNIVISGEDALETVCMEGKDIENAYCIKLENDVVYNTYNLLRGKDDWDPLGVKDIITNEGKDKMPTLLLVQASKEELISGDETITLVSKAFYFYEEEADNVEFTYFVSEEDSKYVVLKDNGDGTCVIEGINDEDFAKDVMVHTITKAGLEGQVKLHIRPSLKEAPEFIKKPSIVIENGVASLEYTADFEGYDDHSIIRWYRCKNEDKSDAILVAVSRNDVPMKEYLLGYEDVGYYLVATIKTNHIRSRIGEEVSIIADERIKKDMLTVTEYKFVTDFTNMPIDNQPQLIPGFVSLDDSRPLDTKDFAKWGVDKNDTAWKYGTTGNGSIGEGLYQAVQGARFRYTPIEGKYGDMSLYIKADPAKTAGQGFGNAGQYMDICIKFDHVTQSGVGIRILRSQEASNGVKFLFVQYNNGVTSFLNEGVLTSCYHTNLEIFIKLCNNVLSVSAQSPISSDLYEQKVDMSIVLDDIETNDFGGVLIHHAGTPGIGGWQNTTMLHYMEINWN